MGEPPLAPSKNPCGSCPYRQDVPPAVWDESEYAKLPPYDLETGDQPMGVFMCHQQDGHICAGWAGCHDMDNNLAMRVAVPLGGMSLAERDKTVDYVSPVPLWSSGTEAAEHGLTELDNPTDKAMKIIRKMERKRGVSQ